LDKAQLEHYLSRVFNQSVELVRAERLGGGPGDVKEFGYGVPYLLEFKVSGEIKRAVLQTMKPDHFGHEHPADRAQSLIWAYSAYSKLPRHVKALDLGVFTCDKELISLKNFEEFFLLVEKAEGREYWRDLEEIAERGHIVDLDRKRCKALSDYLVEIHSVKSKEPELYVRRVRELIGHGECIMGIIDNYPAPTDFISREEFIELEKLCVEWRWRLKEKTYRLCRVHGDYHPWNVLFTHGTEFTVLDRSRGEFGEAADDVAAMTINYLFFSLRSKGRLEGGFEELYKLFISNYLDRTGDEELFKVIQPFYAWRALVIASPVWYPTLAKDVRKKLLNFAFNSLKTENFDPDKVNDYLEAST